MQLLTIGSTDKAISQTLVLAKDKTGPVEPPMSIWQLIKQPGVSFTLFLWCFVSLQGLANTAVLPVFWFTSIAKGGYGFSPLQISLILGISGISQAIWLLFIFPSMQKRYGTGGVLRYSGWIFPLGCISNPLLQFMLRKGVTAPFWFILPTTTMIGASAAMAFTCVQLCVNNVSPSGYHEWAGVELGGWYSCCGTSTFRQSIRYWCQDTDSGWIFDLVGHAHHDIDLVCGHQVLA
jgi:hypothetical protein